MTAIFTRVFIALLLAIPFTSLAQKASMTIGTDIPYQFYVGATIETSKIDISYRTGILIQPYSDVVLNTIESLGVDNVYIRLLESSYDFGWTNSIGGYYKLGEKQKWYVGPELRLDHLTASDTGTELIEAVTGQPINSGPRRNSSINVKMGITLVGVGLRFGRDFTLDTDGRHRIRTELSAAKYLSSTTVVTINDQEAENLTQSLDDLIWQDVFKDYGYVGGIGVSYVYKF